MSHNIEYFEYKENINKKNVQKDLDNYCARATWREGGHVLSQAIRWLDHVCDSYEEAKDYIKKHDRGWGWYDQIAVKYKYHEPIIPSTKGYQKLLARRSELKKLLEERSCRIHYSAENTQSKFVACKECGSRLATKYIKSNHCPLCRKDLRPASVLKGIETARKMFFDINEKIEAEEKKVAKKAKIYWLVKIEYHT